MPAVQSYAYGLSSLLIGAIEPDGGMGLTMVEVFGNTVPGSANIITEDGTTTDINIEETDDPILSRTIPGAMRLNFSTYNCDPVALQAAFGGTLTGTAPNQTWHAPDTIGAIEKSVRFISPQGKKYDFPRVSLNPKLNIVFDKTEAGKIDFSGTVLVPTKSGVKKMSVGPV